MQQAAQTQCPRGARLSTSSYSSTSTGPNPLLNGLLPTHRYSQTSPNIPSNHSPNQTSRLTNSNKIKSSETIQDIIIIFLLTLLLAFLLIITIEFATTLVKHEKDLSLSNLTRITNNTNTKEEMNPPIRSFFACVWFFNVLLFFNCLFIHSFSNQRRSQRDRTRAAFLRDFVRIYDSGNSPTNNTLIDYLMKTCLLCFLWYLSCYLIFRSMTILISVQIIILYSIVVTLRQVLGWIFLHEQFIGNKIIAHILALSALLFLAHDDGFRFNTFLLGLSMVTFAVGFKTIFDILVNGFIKDLTSFKLRIVMINVCLCGTCLLWPFVLLFHLTRVEPIHYNHIRWLNIIITLFSALVFNVLTIAIPFKYTSVASVASLVLVIPSISVIDHYLLKLNYSPLVISAILCSLAGVLLSMIPKQWFQAGEAAKMKQALGLLNKDSSISGNNAFMGTGGPTTGTSSAFEEIRAQRRIRNALLCNEIKT